MDVPWGLMVPLLIAWLLCMVVTGPGMWSEKWGHAWLERAKRLFGRDGPEPPRPPAPPGGGP